ncbi:helix-turn-helix domain-containing protein, partial [Pseudomonas aeruginosa]
MDRLLSVYGVKNDNQLSELLQIKRSTLGNWRSRDSVPYT